MLIILYILCILFILFIKRTEKYTWVLAATMMAFLSVTSTTYADLNNYIPLFNYVNSFEFIIGARVTGIGWVFLNKMFYLIGLNYRGMIVGGLYINYYLMHWSVKRLRGNENLYFGLFLIFPAIIQLVQFKFFTAFCVVFIGYSILMTSEHFPRVKYVVFIIFASSIHISSIMFLILLLVKMERYNKKVFIVITSILTTMIVLFLNSIVSIISNYLNPRLTYRYLVNSKTPSSLLWIISIVFVWAIAFFISTYLLSNRDFKYKVNCLDNRVRHIANYCGMSIEVLLITLPFLLLDRNFHRFLELGYSIMFIMLGMYISPPKYSKVKLLITLGVSLILIVVTLIYSPYSTVLEPIFSFDGFVKLKG